MRTIAKSYFQIRMEQDVAKSTGRTARGYAALRKYNPYHDARGRFSSANSSSSFTIRTKDPSKQRLADNAKEKAAKVSAAYDEAAPIAREKIAQAKEIEKALTPALSSIAAENGAEMLGLAFAVKSEGSLTRKIADEMLEKGLSSKEAAEKMNDINRYTMTNSPERLSGTVQNTLHSMEKKGYQLVRLKNTFEDAGNSYRGINCVMKTPQGTKFELQFHTPDSFTVKDKINHKLYEEQRLSTTSKSRKAELDRIMVENANKIEIPAGIGAVKNFP